MKIEEIAKSRVLTNSLVLKSRELTNSQVLKCRELEILVFHFSLSYNVIGGGMARRYWKIPSSSLGKKKLNSPLAASLLVGNSFFFASGFGGNFPIPSRHIQAIVSVSDFTDLRTSITTGYNHKISMNKHEYFPKICNRPGDWSVLGSGT